MLHREYISTGENLHFLPEVCKQEVCLTTKRRMAKEMQVVGGPNSTDEGMNKINTRGKSRENCSSQFWPAKLYQSDMGVRPHKETAQLKKLLAAKRMMLLR